MIAKVPAKPMQKILANYVKANNIPLRVWVPEELLRAYHHYCKHAKSLN